MQQFANPARFLKLAQSILTPIWVLTAAAFATGLYLALVTAPPDYQQGETVRIMFVHVPAAWMALMVYTAVAVASTIAIIFRHPLADVAAKAAAPIGAMFCLLALVTGSLWGKPMWGAWWVWDARLTSMFVLFLLYLGYMAMWQAIEDPHRAALVARVVAIAGFINVPIVKFSVDWWNSLHQPAPRFFVWADPASMHACCGHCSSWRWPISCCSWVCILIAMRSEIISRKIRQLQFARLEGR